MSKQIAAYAGWITPAEATRMKRTLTRREDREMIDLLTMRPVRASAPAAGPGDDDGDEEYDTLVAALWPPQTPAAVRRHAEARAMLAASAPQDEGELTDAEWIALFGTAPS